MTEAIAKDQEIKQEDIAASEAQARASAPEEPKQPQISIDDASAQACYANFCRVHGTPEELVIDFGLNPQPFGAENVTLKVSQRLAINYFTAKRLMAALQVAVARHERAFGTLETNVQKRALPTPAKSAQASS